MLRDYHSPNLIWLADRDGVGRVGVIDFQDTVLGPAAYDLVSLAQDARVDVPEAVEIALLTRYAKARRETAAAFDPKPPDGTTFDSNTFDSKTFDPKAFDPKAFVESYAIMSAQRNTRLLGTFARLNRRDGKPHYLRHQPRIWTYLTRALAHPALEPLRAWYAAHVPPPAP
jgi:aminoglycoside/choline kinase family phosphotransferase